MRSRPVNSWTRWSARIKAFSALAVNFASFFAAEEESSESTKVASSRPKRTDSEVENQLKIMRLLWRTRRLLQIAAHLREHRVPCTLRRLSVQARRWVPGRVAALHHPAPVGA